MFSGQPRGVGVGVGVGAGGCGDYGGMGWGGDVPAH